MAEKIKTLTVIEEAEVVTFGQEQAYTMIPDDGAEVVIEMFRGSFSGGEKAAICCVWDYGEAGETIVDVVNSGIKKLVATGDGVKKLGLLFTNNEAVNSVAFAATVVVAEIVDV